MLLAVAVIAEAQQPKKVPRIGYLKRSSLSATAARVEAFRQGLRDLGYMEGKNIVIEYRYAEGKLDRYPSARGRTGASQGRHHRHGWYRATRRRQESNLYDSHRHGGRIPILLATGFVASLARPGGNITGLSKPFPGDKWKTTGASERGRSQDFPRGRPRELDATGTTHRR